MVTKTCSECKVEKLTTDFNPDKSRKGGVKGKCKLCLNRLRREYNNTHKDKVRAANIKNYLKHVDERKSYNRAYRMRNADKIRELNREKRMDKLATDQAFKDNENFRRIIKGYRTAGADDDEIDAHRLISKEAYSMWLDFQRTVKQVKGPEDIDHTYPISKLNADDPLEFLIATSVINLSPMNASENRSKGAKVIFELLHNQITLAYDFLDEEALTDEDDEKFNFLILVYEEFVALVTSNHLT